MQVEAWLDGPLPSDALAGSSILVGMTLVSADGTGKAALSPVSPTYLRLFPATGAAAPTQAPVRIDWQGHVRAVVRVPEGGPGAVELGFVAEECHDDGTCQSVEIPFAVGGVGPPPDIPPVDLVTSAVHPPAETPVAGRKLNVDVEVIPRADWDVAALGLPDRVIAIVSQPRGPDVVTAELIRNGAAGSLYEGSITIPRAGEYAIVIAFPGANGHEDQVIAGSPTRLIVEAEAAPQAGPGDAPADAPPMALIAGLGVALVAAGIAISRVFADL